MATYLSVAVAALSLTTTCTGELTATRQPKACNAGNEYVYSQCECLEFVINPQQSWREAQSICAAKGARLVTIHDKEKQNFIADTLRRISDRRGVWIGLTLENDKFQWVDGTSLAGGYSAWGIAEPSRLLTENCALMHKDTRWRWKDFSCTFEDYSYICQYELPCETKSDEETGLSTNEVIGIVVGGVIGVICFFAVVFMLINCCRDAVRVKRFRKSEGQMREVETGSNYADDACTSLPMIAPPEKAIVQCQVNDLDRASIKRKKAPLMTANVAVTAAPAHERAVARTTSIKISNLSHPEQANLDKGYMKRSTSHDSIEDNYLTANTDVEGLKESNSKTGDKL